MREIKRSPEENVLAKSNSWSSLIWRQSICMLHLRTLGWFNELQCCGSDVGGDLKGRLRGNWGDQSQSWRWKAAQSVDDLWQIWRTTVKDLKLLLKIESRRSAFLFLSLLVWSAFFMIGATEALKYIIHSSLPLEIDWKPLKLSQQLFNFSQKNLPVSF
jgi:hypothetical protein